MFPGSNEMFVANDMPHEGGLFLENSILYFLLLLLSCVDVPMHDDFSIRV